MSKLFKLPFGKTLLALLVPAVLGLFALAVFQLSERGSPEDRARSYYEHGVKLIEQHDYATAIIELRNALSLKNDMLPAWRSLAQIEETTQHWDGVIRSLQSIVSLDPKDIEARVKLAKLLALGGRVYQALELTNIGNDADSRNARILGLKAAILYKLNDKPGAVRQAQEAFAIDPGNADALVVLATERMASGDTKGALRILESGAARNITDLGIQLLKLKIFEQLGESQQLESLLRKLIQFHPEDIAFRKQLIKFYVDQHRQDAAENETRAMVEANPTNPEAELDLVRLLYAAKGSAAAKQELVARINSGGDVFSYQIALAEFDFAQGNFADAEQLLQNLVSHSSSTEQTIAAQIKLAEMDVKRNKFDAAEALVSEILRKDSRNTNALKVRASIRIARGQLEPAITDLKQALSDQPRSTEVMLLLAFAYERSGSIGLAERQYAEAVRASNYSPIVGLNYASFLLRRGGVDRAQQFLTELSRRLPKNQEVLSALAQVELTHQDWASAQTTAEAIRDAGDSRGIADQLLGAALLGQHKYDESIAVFQSAVNASPSAVQPMVSLVTALVRAQKTDRAVAFLKSVLQSNPDNAEARVLLGSIQLATSAPDQALESFKLAIEKQPKSVVGYQALANLYVGEKKYDQALEIIRSGLEVQPDSTILHLARAGALEKARQYEAAITEYEQLLSKQPGSMIGANNLASLLSDHRTDKASLDRAQSLAASLQEPQVPQFKDTVGWVLYRRGDYAAAVLLLEKAATALPNIALIHYHLAMSYLAIRQDTKASEQLNAALLLAPDAELEEKIKEALKNLPT
jgi:tetratricopeptide (TPR) repeat protein